MSLAQEICGSWKNLVAAEEPPPPRPVIYIRSVGSKLIGHEWFCLRNDDELSQMAPICKCGAVRELKQPCFTRPKTHRPDSCVAAVGRFIYVFGGYDMDNKVDSGEVSYINTLKPGEGWKVCKEKMPTPRIMAYPINIPDNEEDEEEERLLLVAGFEEVRHGPYAQMYYPSRDKWVASESFPKQRPCYSNFFGHAVVSEGSDTVVLLHDFRSRYLFTYNVSKDSWGTRWENKFGERYHTGALVCGILYVLDVATLVNPARVVLCGYQVSNPKCLPVEILPVQGNKWRGKHCLPLPDRMDQLPLASLLPMGDNKLAMVWDGLCFHDNYNRDCPRQSVYWSIFEMTQLQQPDGGLKLVARPLSHVCYHVYNNGCRFDALVPVYPYRDQSKSPARVPRNDEKVKQNKAADSNKDKEVHHSPKSKSTSGIDAFEDADWPALSRRGK